MNISIMASETQFKELAQIFLKLENKRYLCFYYKSKKIIANNIFAGSNSFNYIMINKTLNDFDTLTIFNIDPLEGIFSSTELNYNKYYNLLETFNSDYDFLERSISILEKEILNR